ncbi:TonB-dependent receptor plug domain-containing protein [Paracidovorax sp. MALMAid1276]|uniref:TonB-dependent receptor plug domain-containing protein n=1 Tax=Paracidovorax sp. MALMAid1276 TaxID=3411631 RepID=UPI003B9B3FCC
MQMRVSTASRYSQTALEAPAAVSVVTAEDIRVFGYRHLGEVLASMRGLYVSYDRSYHYLGLRGFATPGDYNTRVLLLVNGVRFNDNLYDLAAIGTDFPIDLDLVERVEFVPGPGSAVYGANALFGVINVITRNGRDLSGPQVSAEAGSHGAARLRFSLGTVDRHGGDWLVALTRSTTRGADHYYPSFDTPATHHGMAQGLDHDRSTQLFARWSRDGLGLTLAHGERHKGVPTAAFSQVFNDARSRITDTSTRLAAEYATDLSPRLSFSGRIHAGRYRFVGDYVYDYPPVTLNHDVSTGQWWGTEWQWVSTALARHKLSWGMDYRRDASIRQRNFDAEAQSMPYLDTQRSGHALGVFVQDEFALRPDITLHAGVRWGRQSGNAGAWHPRLGLVYWWNPHTALKVLHGTAFRAANAYERDYRVDIPGGVVDTAPIRPERVRTTELALEHATGGSTRLLVTVFRSVVKDLITLADAPVPDRLTFQNARGVHVHGLEAEAEQRFGPQARLRAVYGWQRARDAATQAALTNSPEHLLKLQWSDALPGTAGSPWAASRYAVEAVGMGPRYTLQGRRLPAHVVTNLTVSMRWAQVDASFGIYNLLDRRYADPASFEIREEAIRQNGRTYRVKLTYRF